MSSLTELWDAVPTGCPDLPRIALESRRVRARRRVLTTAGAVAAVALVLMGAVGVRTLAGTTTHATVASHVTLDPPPGTRYAGAGRIAFAVPVAWSTDETQCGSPTADTVYQVSGLGRACLVRGPAPFSLALDTTGSATGRAAAARVAAEGHVEVGGPAVRVERGRLTCHDQVTAAADSGCSVVFVDTSDQVVLTLTSPPGARSELEAIARSMVVLPEGWVTVPFTSFAPDGAVASALRGAGVDVAVRPVIRPEFAAGTVVGSDPPPGTAVGPGSRVTLQVSTGARPDCTQARVSLRGRSRSLAVFPAPRRQVVDLVSSGFTLHRVGACADQVGVYLDGRTVGDTVHLVPGTHHLRTTIATCAGMGPSCRGGVGPTYYTTLRVIAAE